MSVAHQEIDSRPFPRAPLYAGFAMIGLALLVTFAVRLHIVPGQHSAAQVRAEQHVKVVEVRELRFLDQPDGAVRIEDAGRGTVAAIIQPGTNNGFIRGVLRGLARDRKLRHIGRTPPFTLTQYSDGELTLHDAATGRTVPLNSFGPTNHDAFARLLVNPPPPTVHPGQ